MSKHSSKQLMYYDREAHLGVHQIKGNGLSKL